MRPGLAWVVLRKRASEDLDCRPKGVDLQMSLLTPGDGHRFWCLSSLLCKQISTCCDVPSALRVSISFPRVQVYPG